MRAIPAIAISPHGDLEYRTLAIRDGAVGAPVELRAATLEAIE